jgi:GTP-binding protein Era
VTPDPPEGPLEEAAGPEELEAPAPETDEGGGRSGFVTIIGRPNAGKSTLLNRILGEKLAIVTPVPQTTRNRILGVKNYDDGQVVFVDTPGIHKPLHAMNHRMLGTAYAALQGVDLVLVIVDGSVPFGGGDEFLLERLGEHAEVPRFLLVNKVDTINKGKVLEIIDTYRKKAEFAEYIPISALTGDGVEIVEEKVLEHLPVGERYYPPDFVTDLTDRFRVSEVIREKVILATREEVPYSTAVSVERMQERPDGNLIDVDAVIHVERSGQKGILIGAGGMMLKKIGSEARHDLEAMLGRKVFLSLWVKVSKKWREDRSLLDRLLGRDQG